MLEDNSMRHNMLISQELCAESPVQEEDCKADLDTWNKRFLKMLKDEKKEEKKQEQSPKPVFNLRDLDQREQMEREKRGKSDKV